MNSSSSARNSAFEWQTSAFPGMGMRPRPQQTAINNQTTRPAVPGVPSRHTSPAIHQLPRAAAPPVPPAAPRQRKTTTTRNTAVPSSSRMRSGITLRARSRMFGGRDWMRMFCSAGKVRRESKLFRRQRAMGKDRSRDLSRSVLRVREPSTHHHTKPIHQIHPALDTHP